VDGGWTVAALGASELARRVLGSAHTSTAMLGFLARATGWVDRTAVRAALERRFSGPTRDRNVAVALEAFDAAEPHQSRFGPPAAAPAPGLDAPLTVGLVAAPGSSALRPTGGWRTEVPRFLVERCTGCDICAVFCPEGVVFRVEKRRYDFDPTFCKGCGICAAECPTDDIVMEEVLR
jgi:pyruvate ferredoxin oxidoreductase delta subunit